MMVQLMFLLFISYLKIISIETNPTTIELTSENITVYWEIFYRFTCTNSILINVTSMECLQPAEYLEVNDTYCLKKKILNFDNSTCSSCELHDCQNKNYIGCYCNVSTDACKMSDVCNNQGTCDSDKTYPSKYSCHCKLGFSGYNCEHDNRICKNNTCWHDGICVEMNETVSINNITTFQCICKVGYNGDHCELISNMCSNITCENRGVCKPLYLSWSCECLNPSYYSGKYCEIKSTSLIIKQALSKSFASIAITAIIAVFLFVIIMDILKYAFKIDPIDHERQLMKFEQEKKQLKKSKKKKKRTEPALRIHYVP